MIEYYKNEILDFIKKNGWEVYNETKFYNGKNDTCIDFNDITFLIDGSGGSETFSLGKNAIWSLLGYLLHHKYLIVDEYDLDIE